MDQKKEKVVTLDLTGCKNWLELHRTTWLGAGFLQKIKVKVL